MLSGCGKVVPAFWGCNTFTQITVNCVSVNYRVIIKSDALTGS